MSSSLPSSAFKRARISAPCNCTSQVRHATLLRRPHRPYTFTQLITLSDGSTYTARTTSPRPIFKSTKDTRNHPLWQPSLLSLRNVEQDEAGRLRAFRERFGRGWDLDSKGEEGEEAADKGRDEEESLLDLISGTGGMSAGQGKDGKGGKGDVPESEGEGAEKMVKVMRDGVLVRVPAQSKNERRK